MAESETNILKIEGASDCVIIGRLNRFVIEVLVKGNHYHASTNNTGHLNEFIVAGRGAFCIPHQKPLKTDFRLFAIEERNFGALIDTQFQMSAFEKALQMGLVPWLEGYRMSRRNAPLDNSLIDYLLEGNGAPIYLEVKSAVLRDGDYAMHPDCPSARGRKHIRDLTRLSRNGGKAIILFMAALPEVEAFKPNKSADPELCRLLLEARHAGVEIKALNIVYQPQGSFISLLNPDLPVKLE